MGDATAPTAPDVGVVLVAAGSGTRLGARCPKALVPLGPDDDPLVTHALRRVLSCRGLAHVVVVAPPGQPWFDEMTDLVTRTAAAARVALPVPVDVVAGGAERAESVARGLAALVPGAHRVLVHDAARAMTPTEVFDRVAEALAEGREAVTPALPVVDTIKQVEQGEDGEHVVATVDRSTLRAVQTPQGFLRETLERAHAATDGAAPATDDCGMVEALGGRVHVVPGHARAMKVTTPADLELAGTWVEPRQGRLVREGRT